MSNFFGVEETPQLQPAECNWGSGDKSVNAHFLRITNPYTETTTLLMGENFFIQLADALGYVKRDVVEEEQRNLRDELRSARDSLDNLAVHIGDVRTHLDSLDSLQGPLATIRESLGGFETRLNKVSEKRDREQRDRSDDAERSERDDSVRKADEPGEPTEPSNTTGSVLAEREGSKPTDAEQRELASVANESDAAKRVASKIADGKSADGKGDAKRTPESTRKP